MGLFTEEHDQTIIIFYLIGVQGLLTRFDENGDAQGNYTVLAWTPHQSMFSNYGMLPVGHFHLIDNETLPVS